MNDLEKPSPQLPSASEYLLDNFKPTDRIAVLVLNRETRRNHTEDYHSTKGLKP